MIAMEARRPTLFSPSHPLIIALAALISAILLLFLGDAGKTLGFAAFGIGAVVVVGWGLRYTTEHRSGLIFVFVLIDMLMSSFFIPDAVQTRGHYLLDFIFCLPVIPFVLRSGVLRQGGFRLFVVYFTWALITVLYSIAPVFSLGRLARAVLVFSAICAIVTEVENAEDVTRVLRTFLAACGSILAVVAASAIILPHQLTWGVVNPENFDLSEINRFHGIFNSPNHIGALMMISAGTALVCWRNANGGWQRLLLLLVLTSSLGFAALANSRTPFVALAVGGLLYLTWRHGMRALLICTVVAVLLGAAVSFSGFDLYYYAGNRDVSTLTGRTDIWQFVISRIADRPILGYGYAVEGQIFQSRYFPIWWGPWDSGPHSSLHDGYLSRAVGVGIPATLFWLFIVLRPWFSLFRQKDDPWGLKPIALLIVVPLLLHNLSESSLGDFIYEAGVLFGLTWAIAEKRRLQTIEDTSVHSADPMNRLPPAIAALSAALFICFALLAYPSYGFARECCANSSARGRFECRDHRAMRVQTPHRNLE